MNYKYDVSIIIPVYNTEKYIDECLNSIINQNYDFKRIQVILINDGSSDNSLETCNKYGEKYENILVLNQENKGVSAARNNGISKAEGKYIMFVDSDDYISKNTIKVLFYNMEKYNDETDIFVYPRYTYNEETNEIKLLTRFKGYKKTNIFDINEEYYFIQPTLNVIVKNKFNKNILFDENLIFHEDEEYVTKIIMGKKKFGFTDLCKYYYRINISSTTSYKSNPYYCFENYISLYEKFIKNYTDKNGNLNPYIQACIMNDIKWRINQDVFFPYHLKKNEKKKAYERIYNIFKYIEPKVIVNDKKLNEFRKVYFLKLKKCDFSYKINNGKYSVYVDDLLLDEGNKMQLSIEKFKIFDNKIFITANVKNVLLEVLNKKENLNISVKIKKSNDSITYQKLKLLDSNYGEYKTKIKTNNFYAFNFELDISDVKEFSFVVDVNDNRFATRVRFGKKTPFRILKNKYVSDNYIIKLIGNLKSSRVFKVESKNLFNTLYCNTSNNLKTAVKYPKYIMEHTFYKKDSKKDIWLYNDNKNNFDNAYVQFMHDIKKDDGIIRYYVSFDNVEKTKEKFGDELMNNIIYYGSKKHKKLFINCDKVISSFHDFNIYSPFKKDTFIFNDITHYEFVYLQHGILHAYMPWEYSNEKNNEFDRVVISTKFEYTNFISKYNYAPNQLIKSGMPRLDFLNVKEKKKNKILYAPSWRKHLVGNLTNEEWQPKEQDFLESTFYKESQSFLNSDELQKVLKKYNMILEFKNHPIFEKYNKLYKIKNDNVKIVKGNINESEYKLVITDYSSFIFDYVYLKTPVLYFVPDNDLFVAGVTHHYRKLDLPLEEGFGPISENSKSLIVNLEKYIKSDFKIEKKYLKKYDDFFYNVKNHSEKLYNELLKDKE